MERKSMVRIGIISGIAVLVVMATAGIVLSRTGKSVSATGSGATARAEKEAPGEHGKPGEEARAGGGGHGDEGEREGSDLDRPVDELWSARCEHDILQYTCDECRFGIGTVKLPSALLSKDGNPGLVGVTTAGGRSYKETRSFTGGVKPSGEKTVHVTSPLPGQVSKVFVDIGARVKAGDPLFEIDSHEVHEAKGEYLKKEASRDLAKRTAEREKTLFQKKISAESEVLEAGAKLAEAEVDLANARAKLLRLGVPESEIASMEHRSMEKVSGLLVVKAPRAGVVLERHLSLGERIEPARELFLLSDLSEVWVWAELREGDIPAVARRTNGGGGKIPAVVRAPDGKEYRGTLDILSGTMSEETRTLKARVVVPNPDGLLRPGMFVTVRLFLSDGGSVLVVPRQAVLADEGRTFVFVHKEGEYWVRRPVTLGRRLGDMVEIAGGLSPGQTVVSDGSFLLKSDVLRKKMGAGCAD